MPIQFSVCRPNRHYSQEEISSVPGEQLDGAGDSQNKNVVTLADLSPYNAQNGPGSLDRADGIPEPMEYSWFEVGFIVFSIVSFFFDIITDILVASFYWHNGDTWYFTMTVIFITIPTLVVTGISLRWYIVDSREELAPKVSTCTWIIRAVFLILQLGPVIRYIESLIYGLKFKLSKNDKSSRKKWFKHMVYEDTDASMLRLFECFMESAPQLVLQLYIVFHRQFVLPPDTFTIEVKVSGDRSFFQTPVIQTMSILASLTSLSWSLVSYHQMLRMSMPCKINMNWKGMIVQFFWRFFMIGSRVLVLALFSARWQYYVGIFCLIHWGMAFLWILSMKTCFCRSRCEEVGYNALLAVMFIFCYFNPVDSPTRWRYTIYYVTAFIENSILLVLFFLKTDSRFLFLDLAGISGHYVAFILGLTFMVSYFLYHDTSLNLISPSFFISRRFFITLFTIHLVH